MNNYITKYLARFFLINFTLFGSISSMFWDEYTKILYGSLIVGLFVPLVIVPSSIFLKDKQIKRNKLSIIFGPESYKVVSYFNRIHNKNMFLIYSITIIFSIICGISLFIWFKLQYFGWHFTPSVLYLFSAGASFLGAIAGPGLGILLLTFFASEESELGNAQS